MTNRHIFLTVAISLFGLVILYPSVRLLTWLGASTATAWGVGMLVFAAVIGIRVYQELINSLVSRQLSAISMTWLGVSFIALCFCLVAEFFGILGSLSGLTINYQLMAQITLATTTGTALYGLYNAQRLHTFVLDVNAPADVRGTTLAQISDVHVGSRLPGWLERVVAHTNALNPDYVVITGDLIDMRQISINELKPLAELRAPTLFCTGNHERYVDLEDICDRLRALNINVLRNSAHSPPAQPELCFIGIDDAESKQQVAQLLPDLAARAPSGFRILLYHRPDGMTTAAQQNINLMLTGHTHRGQIVPFNILVKRVFPEYYRSYIEGDCTLYVSPGSGTWGPVLRLGSKCEITLIRLL